MYTPCFFKEIRFFVSCMFTLLEDLCLLLGGSLGKTGQGRGFVFSLLLLAAFSILWHKSKKGGSIPPPPKSNNPWLVASPEQ